MSKQVTLMTDAIPYQEFAKLIGKIDRSGSSDDR